MKYCHFLWVMSGAFVCMTYGKSVYAADADMYPPANTGKQKLALIPSSHEDFQKLPSDPKGSWADSSQHCYGEFEEANVSEGKPMGDIYLPQ